MVRQGFYVRYNEIVSASVAVIVPYRSDNGHRDRIWLEQVQPFWKTMFPEWTISVGIHEEGPFNRSKAINTAVNQIKKHDVYIIVDNDSLPDPIAVEQAVVTCQVTQYPTVAHTQRLMLKQGITFEILGGRKTVGDVKQSDIQDTYYESVSCCLVITRDMWESTGGFDERFVGWGFEDSAFAIALSIVTGGKYILKVDAVNFHLWHEMQPEHVFNRKADAEALKRRQANLELLHRYEAAERSHDQIGALDAI